MPILEFRVEALDPKAQDPRLDLPGSWKMQEFKLGSPGVSAD